MYAKNSFFHFSSKALWSLALVAALGFSACSDDNDDQPQQEVNEEISGAYFLNYGSYGNGGASITRYNFRKDRSEEHTSELQSRPHLVCRLLREKKKHKRRVRAGLVRGCGAVERRAEVGRGSGADGGREAGEDDLHGGRALEDAELAGDRECAAA